MNDVVDWRLTVGKQALKTPGRAAGECYRDVKPIDSLALGPRYH
jgi:hypothetical protein